jgi:hypothetical protein
MRLLACRNAGCDPRPDLGLDPTESAIGQAHAGRKLPCTFQTLPLCARKPSDTANLALAEEAVGGKHWVDWIHLTLLSSMFITIHDNSQRRKWR